MNRTVFIAMPGNPSTPSRRAMRPSDASRQQGTALVMALVILLVMTIFGLSIMNTTSLESKMATNAQESNRAFHMAESALERDYSDGSNLANLPLPGMSTSRDITDYLPAIVTVETTYATMGNTPPRAMDPDQIYSATDFGTANFEQFATATTNTSANTELKQGVTQIRHKYVR